MMNKQKKKSKWKLSSGLALIILFAISLGLYLINNNSNKAGFNIDSPVALSKAINMTPQKEISYEIYYQKGCTHCENVIKHGLFKLTTQTKKRHSVFLIETNKFKKPTLNPTTWLNKSTLANNWYQNNQIKQTPTVIVRYNHNIIYNYSGTNMTLIKQLLNQTDPKTGKPFDTKHIKSMTIQNDFNHNEQVLPIHQFSNLDLH